MFAKNVLPPNSPLDANSASDSSSEFCKEDAQLITGFVKWDRDGNGTLQKDEVMQMLQHYGNHQFSPNICDKIFNAFDVNHDGVMD